MLTTSKILVLCSGNSARSQLAEGYFNYYAGQHVQVYSAGIINKGVSPYTIIVMAEDNLDITHQMSKSYSDVQDIEFDYLITVCEEAGKQVPSSLKYKKYFHLPFPDPDKAEGGPIEKLDVFRSVRDQIKKEIIKFTGEHLTQEVSPQTV